VIVFPYSLTWIKTGGFFRAGGEVAAAAVLGIAAEEPSSILISSTPMTIASQQGSLISYARTRYSSTCYRGQHDYGHPRKVPNICLSASRPDGERDLYQPAERVTLDTDAVMTGHRVIIASRSVAGTRPPSSRIAASAAGNIGVGGCDSFLPGVHVAPAYRKKVNRRYTPMDAGIAWCVFRGTTIHLFRVRSFDRIGNNSNGQSPAHSAHEHAPGFPWEERKLRALAELRVLCE
jgi:hypothetical protein